MVKFASEMVNSKYMWLYAIIFVLVALIVKSLTSGKLCCEVIEMSDSNDW